MLLRPWRLPEALWAVLGAVLLVCFSLLPAAAAWRAVGGGTDVYFFLIGMMLLAEIARREGLFDWVAAHAVCGAAGSPIRLFSIVYLVGTIVTIFLSNDATAVVLTPAVSAAAKRAGAKPLPYLLTCAFVANAASFVLPISNPANLVVFGARLPSLWNWLSQFTLPSLAAVILTFAVLRLTQRASLSGTILRGVTPPALKTGGKLAAAGIALTAAALLTASSLDCRLGLPTFLAAALTAALCVGKGSKPLPILRGISWAVIPLVAALFVLVKGVEATGVFAPLAQFLAAAARASPRIAALAAGSVSALACNVTNNLPLGLTAGTVADSARLAAPITGALLIGIDSGPNLSVTGSLATFLWLVALRREGEPISAARFLLTGMWVMPPALIASLAIFIWAP